jgi:outer membrane protein
VLLQEASVARARADLVGARRDARVAELAIAELVRLPPGTPLRVCGLGRRVPPPRSVEDLVAEARAASPTLAALRAAVDAAEAGVEAARAEGRPTVDLVARAGASAPLAGGTSPAMSAGLALDAGAPLADRGRTREGVAVAELALTDARDALARADEALAVQVHAAVEEVRAAVAGVAAARAAREASEAALAVVEARYDAGAGVMADLLAARAGARAAQVADTRAGWELARARVELDAVLGRR